MKTSTIVQAIIGINIVVVFVYFFYAYGSISKPMDGHVHDYDQTARHFIDWHASKPWIEYILSYKEKNKGIGRNIKNNCKRVAAYQEKRLLREGIPPRNTFLIVTDYPENHLVVWGLRQAGFQVETFFEASMYVQSQNNIRIKKDLNEKADLFFFNSWQLHLLYEIGKDFLCPRQSYNHIPGFQHLGNKDEIVLLSQEYAKKFTGEKAKWYNHEKLFPLTYLVQNPTDWIEIVNIMIEESKTPMQSLKWMRKIARDVHGGKGVEIMTEERTKQFIEQMKYGAKWETENGRLTIIQKYIGNPFLLNGFKFDFRTYMFVVSMNPYVVLWHRGYLRLAVHKYDEEDMEDFNKHITNTGTAQRYTADDAENKEEIMAEQTWMWEKFQDYMVGGNHVSKERFDEFQLFIKKTVYHIAHMSRDLFLPHPGVFDLMGADFLMDNDLNLWFIEATPSPGIQSNTKEKEVLQTKMVQDMVKMRWIIEYGGDLDAIVEQSDFEYIYDARKPQNERHHGLIEPECHDL